MALTTLAFAETHFCATRGLVPFHVDRAVALRSTTIGPFTPAFALWMCAAIGNAPRPLTDMRKHAWPLRNSTVKVPDALDGPFGFSLLPFIVARNSLLRPCAPAMAATPIVRLTTASAKIALISRLDISLPSERRLLCNLYDAPPGRSFPGRARADGDVQVAGGFVRRFCAELARGSSLVAGVHGDLWIG